jgi:MFS family permease
MRAEAADTNPRRLSYCWVVLAACTALITIAYGLMFSYGVFFKPLARHFHWDQTETSAAYSITSLLRGFFSILVGWLADKFGPRPLLICCGILVFVGFASSSQVHTLWQFFLTYGVVLALGLSGTFGISTSMVTQWFTKRSGLALGIASMGSGLGTLIVVPISARLITTHTLSETFLIYAVAAGLLMVLGALLMRNPPKIPGKYNTDPRPNINNVSFGEALRQPELYLVSSIMFCLVFCAQIIIVHLVNYATEIGLSPLRAAGIVSLIGLVSLAGRFITGYLGDKIDIVDLTLIAPMVTLLSFLILIFSKSEGALYAFAVFYALSYGAEVPLVPMLAKRYFGTKSMAALVGVFLFAGGVGGAAGPLVAGMTFDMTHSYKTTFVVGAILLTLVLIPISILKSRGRKELAASKQEASVGIGK